MSFLVLTPEGFRDLRNQAMPAGTTVHVNPGIATDHDIALLEQRGIIVHALPHAVDPDSETSLRLAIGALRAQFAGPVWLDATPLSTPGRERQAAAPITERKRFHTQLLDGASHALAQLRRVRASGKRLLLIPYLGYGNGHRITLRGRVLEDEGLGASTREASSWENLIGLYKRLESDQVPGARVLARFQGMEQQAVTDDGGYFSIDLHFSVPLTSAGWHEMELRLLDPQPEDGADVIAHASVLIPSPDARFGVISDIDDTVLWTNVTNKLNMMLMLARSNAHTRKPFKGVAAFYRALHEGAEGKECNPFFYVSSSPWHLYEPLLEFLRMQDIPVGPLMLKELGLRKLLDRNRHHGHKLAQIDNIVSMFPDLPFILIGDSGEQDPEIYAEVVKRYPDAVRVIYIRNVNPDPGRIEALDRLIEQVRATGAQLVIVPDSEFAATHAAAEGLIKPLGVGLVRHDKQVDEALEDGADESTQ